MTHDHSANHSDTIAGKDAALDVRDLKFQYSEMTEPDDYTVIDVSRLVLQPSEQVLLAGDSGSGKSTLLHLIAGLLEPRSGTVTISGQNIHALRAGRRDRLRGSHIGMIFQTHNLLQGFSALENVMAALMFSAIPPREHKDRAASLLKSLGIERVDADPSRLSVGQQQRVAVARAVVCNPALVLADEPTASLDPRSAGVAMDVIQQACRQVGAALLCVSHDPTMVTRFTRREALSDLRSQLLHSTGAAAT